MDVLLCLIHTRQAYSIEGGQEQSRRKADETVSVKSMMGHMKVASIYRGSSGSTCYILWCLDGIKQASIIQNIKQR